MKSFKNVFTILFFVLLTGGYLFADCETVPLNSSSWVNPNLDKYSYQGYEYKIQATSQGLYVPGAPWKNGCKNNVCDGNNISTVKTYNFQNGGDVYITLIPDGGNKYMWFGATIESLSYKNLTTDHSWNGSYVVSHNVKLFFHIKVNQDKTYKWSVCENNYDDQGGTNIASFEGELSDTQYNTLADATIRIWFGDNYAGTAASLLVTEVKVCLNSVSGGGSSSSDSCSSCEVTYDFFTGTLNIPCMRLNGKLYWIKMQLKENGTFGISDYGVK